MTQRLHPTDARHGAGNSHLPFHRLPVKHEGSARVAGEVSSFVAFVVGVEGESALIDAAEQHDARGNVTSVVGRGQRHRMRFIDLRVDRFAHPVAKLDNRVGGDILFVEFAKFVFLARGGHELVDLMVN